MNDVLTTLQNNNHPIGAEKLTYSFFYEQYLLVRNQPLYFPRHPMIRFFTDQGSFDVIFCDPNQLEEWKVALNKYWESIFTEDHLIAKKDTVRVCLRSPA